MSVIEANLQIIFFKSSHKNGFEKKRKKAYFLIG